MSVCEVASELRLRFLETRGGSLSESELLLLLTSRIFSFFFFIFSCFTRSEDDEEEDSSDMMTRVPLPEHVCRLHVACTQHGLGGSREGGGG